MIIDFNNISRYLVAYEKVLTARQKQMPPDFYKKSSLEELEAINEFNAAKEVLFKELCDKTSITYRTISNLKVKKST